MVDRSLRALRYRTQGVPYEKLELVHLKTLEKKLGCSLIAFYETGT